MSTVRMVLMPNKLWALKTFDGKKYGLSFKIMHLEVEPVQRRSLKEYFENDAFVDSDEEGSADDVNEDNEDNEDNSETPVLNQVIVKMNLLLLKKYLEREEEKRKSWMQVHKLVNYSL